MGHYGSPESAYQAFFDSFNARDLDGWAEVNSYPHARVSAAAADSRVHWRPPTRIFADVEEYVSAPIWSELEATGWARTQAVQPQIVQSSPIKAHVAGGWTRYDADETANASNRIVYVMTKMPDGWGIQAQLKTDSFVDGQDFSTEEATALGAVESALTLLVAHNVDAYAEALSYPFTLIGPPGVVISIDSATEMAAAMRSVGDDQLDVPAGSARIVNCGASGANVTFRVERDGAPQEALALVGVESGIWRIKAISGI